MNKTIYDKVIQQFAIDYNFRIEDFENNKILITPLIKHTKARKFENDSILNILTFQGKLVISAIEPLLPWCEEVLQHHLSPQWAFEAQALISIDHKLHEFHHMIDQAHIFFLPDQIHSTTSKNITWLEKDEIKALEADERIDEAFLFEDYIEDVLGASLLSDQNELLAIAGATANSDLLWEIGCNSFDEGKGHGTTVVSALTNEIYKRGKIPYTGTALSHIASQKLSLSSGFRPAFCELRTRPMDE